MSREQPLQPRQADPSEHGNEQWALCDRRRLGRHRIQLLGFDRQQLKRRCPDLTGSFVISRQQTHPCRQLTRKRLDRRGTSDNGDQALRLELPALEQGLNKGPGHAAQADHTQIGSQDLGAQRAAAPQAGEGAALLSSSLESLSRLTTVGAEVSSWLVLVTVTQLGANRKMLSPTRS